MAGARQKRASGEGGVKAGAAQTGASWVFMPSSPVLPGCFADEVP